MNRWSHPEISIPPYPRNIIVSSTNDSFAKWGKLNVCQSFQKYVLWVFQVVSKGCPGGFLVDGWNGNWPANMVSVHNRGCKEFTRIEHLIFAHSSILMRDPSKIVQNRGVAYKGRGGNEELGGANRRRARLHTKLQNNAASVALNQTLHSSFVLHCVFNTVCCDVPSSVLQCRVLHKNGLVQSLT